MTYKFRESQELFPIEFQAALILDMATEIKDQLKNIEIDSIRYHLLKKTSQERVYLDRHDG